MNHFGHLFSRKIVAMLIGLLIFGGQVVGVMTGAIPATHVIADTGDENWDPGFGYSGTNGVVRAIVIDTNGNAIVGGQFTGAGTVRAKNVARWNGSTWAPIGDGLTAGEIGSNVTALAVDSENNLYATLNYEVIECTAPDACVSIIWGTVQQWNGTTWNQILEKRDYMLNALAVDAQDRVYIGSKRDIMQWNGTTWSSLGIANGPINALAIDQTGKLYAGGGFTSIGGTSAAYIVSWNGTAWAPLKSGMDDIVRSLAIDSANQVYAGGEFTKAGGITAQHIAHWDGTNWMALGAGTDLSVDALAIQGDDLYAGGTFETAGSVTAKRIARWNGTAWSALGSGMGPDPTEQAKAVVYAVAVHDGSQLYAGGYFSTAGDVTAKNIAHWTSSAWVGMPGQTRAPNGPVYALVRNGVGNLYAGGRFTSAAGVTVNYVARWDRSTWNALGNGLKGIVRALVVDGAGNLYAGGDFTSAGNVTTSYIARWNGTAWTALGSGMNGPVYALALDGTGNLYAGGNFTTAGGVNANNIARWSGTAWTALGSGLTDRTYGFLPFVTAVATDSKGNVYAGGDFTKAGGAAANYIARWNGTTWSPLAQGVTPDRAYSPVAALAVDSKDNLYVGGDFIKAGQIDANRIARWNGSAWHALGNGVSYEQFASLVLALTIDEDDTVYAGGRFTLAGTVAANNVAHWNGSTWKALGSGVSESVTYDPVNAVVIDSQGTLVTGGNFTVAGTRPSLYFAQWFPNGAPTPTATSTTTPTRTSTPTQTTTPTQTATPTQTTGQLQTRVFLPLTSR